MGNPHTTPPPPQAQTKGEEREKLFRIRGNRELEALPGLCTKSLSWVPSSQTDDDEVLCGG